MSDRTNDGIYKGDVFYETLESHLATTKIGGKWQAVCETELGFPHGEVSPDPIQGMHPYVRLFGTVVHARIEFLADFDRAVTVDDDNKLFLQKLQAASSSRGRKIVAVPEDLLLMLILKGGGPFLTQRYVRECAGFDPRITEAIFDCLTIPN